MSEMTETLVRLVGPDPLDGNHITMIGGAPSVGDKITIHEVMYTVIAREWRVFHSERYYLFITLERS